MKNTNGEFMKSLLITFLSVLSFSTFAANCFDPACYEFEAYEISHLQAAVKIKSCCPMPLLYIVTRAPGNIAPENCDQGELVYAVREILEEKEIEDIVDYTGGTYSYRMCAYSLRGARSANMTSSVEVTGD